MENPKAVSRFLWGTLGSMSLLLLGFSLSIGDFSVLAAAGTAIGLLVVSCAGVALIIAILIGPLVWLLSSLASRKPKHW